jgi:hypothetical protein
MEVEWERRKRSKELGLLPSQKLEHATNNNVNRPPEQDSGDSEHKTVTGNFSDR